MNATSTFATPPVAGPIFRPTRRGNRPPGARATMPDWNNDRTPCFVRPVPPLRRKRSCRRVKTPFGRQPGPGNPTLGQRIAPVPDLALPLHSTGAKP
jgi:hypothetical protein